VCAEALPRAPVLVHCTHGKDRTGLLVSLLLHAAGASAEEVAAEYARTDAWAATAEGRAAQEAMLPARLAARLDLDGFCRASPATLHELWRRVEARYGSVDGYMSAIGVAPATRAALRDALTAPRPPAEGGPAAGGERGQ